MNPALLDRPKSRALVAGFTVFTHMLACGGLLLIANGTETNPDWEDRLRFVREHRTLWCAVWITWMVTSASLLLFCLAWRKALLAAAIAGRVSQIACGIIAVGVLFDFAGEITLIVAGFRAENNVDDFAQHVRLYQFLSPAIANGLYGVGGLMLSIVSWRGDWLRGLPGGLGFAVWGTAFGLTLGAVLDHRQLMVSTGGLVMVLFLAFASDMGYRMYHQGSPDDDLATIDGEQIE